MMKTLAEHIEDMLVFKESIGYCRQSYEDCLMRFLRFMDSRQMDVTDLNEEVILSWCTRLESESPTGARRRIQTVRELLKYLFAIGIDCYVIPSSFLPRKQKRTPYIFTDQELLSIFDVCDNLKPRYADSRKHLILPVLLRLCFYCGLRPNEARELQSCDIDFDNGILLVRKNKTHKERYVSMSDDMLQMCKTYNGAASSVFADHAYFFPSPNGLPYSHSWLAYNFRAIWREARPSASKAAAVVYDLRHRYATTMLMKWMDEGADIVTKVPYLSAYMGHTEFSATAYYIHLLPENLIRSAAIDWDRFSDLIPEVTEDE